MRLLVCVFLGVGTGVWGSDRYRFDDEVTAAYIKNAQEHRLTEAQAHYLSTYVEAHASAEGMDPAVLKDKIQRACQDSAILRAFKGIYDKTNGKGT